MDASTRGLIATGRAHWAIENALHWQLDVSFREDGGPENLGRNRKDNGPANIAILRRRALDFARRDTSKGSLSIKLKRADWSDALLLSLLQQLERVAFNRIHAVTRTRLQAQTLPRVAA